MNAAILRALLFALSPEGNWGLPGLIWGEPGTGKTAMMRQIAAATGLTYYRLSPAERGEGAFGVVPVPGADGFLHYPAPAWSQLLAGGGLIFLDEISCAPPALQSSLLGLVQLRTLGDHQFNAHTRIIGAANETSDAAGGWDLAPALCNRFGHFDFEGLSVSDWASGILGAFKTGSEAESAAAGAARARKLEEQVTAAWPSHDAYARGMVSAFISRRPELLHKRPQRGETGQRAWPSRRSVEYAAVALASSRVHGLNESDTDTLMAAFVGLPWVTEFRGWTAMQDLPAPEDVLDGKVKFKHDERRPDRTMAVLSSCAALIIPAEAAHRKERAVVCWQLVADVIKDAADMGMPAARAMLKAGGLWIKGVSDPVLAKLQPILVAAGIDQRGA